MTAIERYRFIRGKMVEAGVTNVQIARTEKVSLVYVHHVLKGNRTGYRIRRAIAREINQPVENLWPDTPIQYREAA